MYGEGEAILSAKLVVRWDNVLVYVEVCNRLKKNRCLLEWEREMMIMRGLLGSWHKCTDEVERGLFRQLDPFRVHKSYTPFLCIHIKSTSR